MEVKISLTEAQVQEVMNIAIDHHPVTMTIETTNIVGIICVSYRTDTQAGFTVVLIDADGLCLEV